MVYKDDGTPIEILTIGRDVDTTPMAGGSSSLSGVCGLRMADGSHVNMIDENTFQVVETGEKLSKRR